MRKYKPKFLPLRYIPKDLIDEMDQFIDGENAFTKKGYWNYYQFLGDAVKEWIKELREGCGLLKTESPSLVPEWYKTELSNLLPKFVIPKILGDKK